MILNSSRIWTVSMCEGASLSKSGTSKLWGLRMKLMLEHTKRGDACWFSQRKGGNYVEAIDGFHGDLHLGFLAKNPKLKTPLEQFPWRIHVEICLS